MSETLSFKTEEMKKIDALLDKKNELTKDLNKLVGELDNIEINLSDSENRTEQQLNNKKRTNFLKGRILILQEELDVLNSQIDEVQGIKSKEAI